MPPHKMSTHELPRDPIKKISYPNQDLEFDPSYIPSKKKQMKTDEMNMREREMWGPSASQEPA